MYYTTKSTARILTVYLVLFSDMYKFPNDPEELMGVMHMDVDKVADMVVHMGVDMVSGRVAARISKKCKKS